MSDFCTNIAVIPARSGSKGLPQKNILPFCDKPLIAWTIEQAVKSTLVDRVVAIAIYCDVKTASTWKPSQHLNIHRRA